MAIGEVLSALRPEFPDITISKIRFLDGAGLVSPQRSGSGYRRFAEADLLRLRQVLLLQRDHYLPLRVIRDHIAAGSLDGALAETARPPVAAPAPAEAVAPAPAEAVAPAPAEAVAPAPAEAVQAGGAGQPAQRVQAAQVVQPVQAAQVVQPAALPQPSAGAEPAGPVRPAGPGASVGRIEAGERVEPGAPATPRTPPAGARARPVSTHPAPARPVAPQPTSAPSASAHPTVARPAVAGSAPREVPGPPAARTFAGPPRRLRVEDLLRASGLSIETVTELETAGLLRSRNGWYYPEDLTVALAAAQLAAHGIGPRHLRSLRNGADRELGLLEQSLAPVLRRARPDARTRAEDTARTLRDLYSQVHSALVTAGLRDLGVDPR